MENMEEVIAAFVDDERVDTDSLKRALALPEGRDYLVELLAMRELVAMPIDPALVQPAVKGGAPRRWSLAAAAALLLAVSSAGGFFAGARLGRPTPQTGETSTPSVIAPSTATVVAPAPTKVIRLESGVDWTERGGGGD